MADKTTIDAVKLSLRIKTDALDDDIASEIDACLADLTICGVSANPYDPIILKAVKLWCRNAFDADVNSRQNIKAAYNEQKGTLMVSTGYTNYANDGHNTACNAD